MDEKEINELTRRTLRQFLIESGPHNSESVVDSVAVLIGCAGQVLNALIGKREASVKLIEIAAHIAEMKGPTIVFETSFSERKNDD